MSKGLRAELLEDREYQLSRRPATSKLTTWDGSPVRVAQPVREPAQRRHIPARPKVQRRLPWADPTRGIPLTLRGREPRRPACAWINERGPELVGYTPGRDVHVMPTTPQGRAMDLASDPRIITPEVRRRILGTKVDATALAGLTVGDLVAASKCPACTGIEEHAEWCRWGRS